MLLALDTKINQRKSIKYFNTVLFSFTSLYFDFETISKRLITKWFKCSLVYSGRFSIIFNHLTDPLKLLSQIADEQLLANLANGADKQYNLIHKCKPYCSTHFLEALND